MPRQDLDFWEWRALNKAPKGGKQTSISSNNFGYMGGPGYTPTSTASNPTGAPPPVQVNSKYSHERPSQPQPWIEDVDMSADWYSPFQPVWPFGPPYTTRPREWDYPVGYNLNYIPQRIELFSMLRGMRASWGVLATIIETRKDQLLRIPWTIQLRDKPRGKSAAVDEMRKFFKRPDGKLSYSQWSRKLLDDLFVIDAPTIYFSRNRSGRPLAAEVMDGATIFPLIDDAGRRPDSTVEISEDGFRYLKRQPAFQQIIKGLPMVDLDESELMYVPMRPRPDLPIFGYPPTEQILVEASEAVRKTFYQLNFWADGTIPDLIVTVPDNWCYSEDTEVLTRKGWKRFTEVDISTDEFATRNVDNKEFEWQRANGINLSDYCGDMIWLKSKTIDCLVNPPHRVLISYKGFSGTREFFITAEELLTKYNGRYRIPVNSVWNGTPIEDKIFEQDTNRGGGRSLSINGDLFCSFMGMWLSEGWCGDRDICIAQKHSSKGHVRFNNILTDMLGDGGFSYDNHTFRFYNAPFARYLSKFGRAREKFIPDEIMNATKAQIVSFLETFVLGDGSFNKETGQIIIYTSSCILADQMQELAQKIGMSASIGVDNRIGRVVEMRDGREVVTENIQYIVCFSRSEARKFAMGTGKYNGKIGCVSVPNGTLYVRRNGKACWSGNTPRQIAMFQGHFDALLSGNIQLKSKVRFLPGGMKPFDIKNSSGESLWSQRDETLIRLACYGYSVSPTPFVKQTNRATATNAQQTAEEEGLYPLMCHSADTEILTLDGWKDFADISLDDQIATVSSSTIELEYYYPTHIFEHDVSDVDLIHFQTSGVDVLVTENHDMWVRSKNAKKLSKTRASDCDFAQYYFIASVWYRGGFEKESFVLPPVVSKWSHITEVRSISMDTWLQFLGYFISEGGLINHPGTEGFTITQSKNKLGEGIINPELDANPAASFRDIGRSRFNAHYCDISYILGELDISVKPQIQGQNSDVLSWHVSNKRIWNWLHNNVGTNSFDKRIPREFLNLSVRQLRILFTALMCGDGSWDKREGCDSGAYYTTSKKLADDVQELALRLGFSAQVVLNQTYNNRFGEQEVWRVGISVRMEHALSRGHRNTPASRSIVPYTGKVYCVEVPNHLFVTRRNGKIGIHGNSYWKDDIIDPIIQEKFGFDDVEFIFLPRPEPDQEKQSKILDMKVRSGRITIDEARAEDGLEPYGNKLGQTPLVYTGAGAIPLDLVVSGQALAPGTPNAPPGKSGGNVDLNTKPGQPQSGAPRPRGASPQPPAKPTPIHKLIADLLKVSAKDVRHAAAESGGDIDRVSHLQQHVGNYKKGHIWIQGLNISIENEKGSYRGEKDQKGKKWQVKMPAPYGYIRGTIGADNMQVDVYLGKHPNSPTVWVIDQDKVTHSGENKGFDEHKVMLGYNKLKRALRDYLKSHFDGHGHERLNAVTELSISDFKNWLKDGNMKEPISDQNVGDVVLRGSDLRKLGDTISAATGLDWYDQTTAKPKTKKSRKRKAGPRWLQLEANV